MKFKALIVAGLIAGSAVFAAPSAHAATGMYTESLTRCIVESTTDDDKRSVVTWIFSIIALHPDVQGMMLVSDAEREDANKRIANLLETLLTKTCRAQAVDAIKYEGDAALGKSFETLGQIAMTELLNHPNVNAGLSGFTKYVDVQSVEKALRPAQSKSGAQKPAKPAPAKPKTNAP